MKIVGKKKETVKIVISGAGAAAVSIAKLLLSAGFTDIIMCDRKGAIYTGREGLNWIKEEMAGVTNLGGRKGTLAQMLEGADVFVGVSAPGMVTTDMVKTMARDAVILPAQTQHPKSSLTKPWLGAQQLSLRDGATFQTRLTTCWRFREFSGEPLMFGQATSMRR